MEKIKDCETIEEMEELNNSIWKRNVELRHVNNELKSHIKRLENSNAQQFRTMQLLLKVINYCERSIDLHLEQHFAEELKDQKEKDLAKKEKELTRREKEVERLEQKLRESEDE